MPKREGYTFVGWDKEFYRITKPIKIQANYKGGELATNTVCFYGKITGNSSWILLKEERVPEGGNAHPPQAPIYAGYTFREWGSDYSNIHTNKTIYAQYDKNENFQTYTVRFWNGSKLLKSEKVPEGGTATAPAIPEAPKGYYFRSWDKGFAAVEGNLDVYALFEKNPEEELTTTEEYKRQVKELGLPKPVEEKLIELGIEAREWADSQIDIRAERGVTIVISAGLLALIVIVATELVKVATPQQENLIEFPDIFRSHVGTIPADIVLGALMAEVTQLIGEKDEGGSDAITDELGGIAVTYPDFKCKEAAIEMAQYLEKKKQEYKIIQLKYPSGGTIISLSREVIYGYNHEKTKISDNGFHYGVEYNGIVHCNVHPLGLPREAWLSDFWYIDQYDRKVNEIPLSLLLP